MNESFQICIQPTISPCRHIAAWRIQRWMSYVSHINGRPSFTGMTWTSLDIRVVTHSWAHLYTRRDSCSHGVLVRGVNDGLPLICETWGSHSYVSRLIHRYVRHGRPSFTPRTSTPCELESCRTYKWAHEWVSTRMNGSPWMSYDTYQQAMVLINKSWYVGVSPASSHDTSIVCCSVLQCVAVCCSVYGSTRYIQRWMNGTRSNVACQVATIHVT